MPQKQWQEYCMSSPGSMAWARTSAEVCLQALCGLTHSSCHPPAG